MRNEWDCGELPKSELYRVSINAFVGRELNETEFRALKHLFSDFATAEYVESEDYKKRYSPSSTEVTANV